MKKLFEIWAPKAEQMTLCIEGKEIAMQKYERGFWRCELEVDNDKSLYGYKIDGKGPFPDPKSRYQPAGVHGLSQLWPDNFTWSDDNFRAIELGKAVIYELHIGTFTQEGTFAGVAKKLDHLKSLGVTHIEFLPVATFPGKNGWGYDGVDLFAPHHSYGTPTDLKQLVNICHQKELAVILDVVYNHLGPDGNYLGLYGNYFSDRYHTPWGEAVNFDGPHSDQVRNFIIENALYWLKEFHFDGLRLDAIHAIFDFSATHILEELQLNVEKLGKEMNKPLFLIAESSLNDPRIIRPREKGGYELASQWLDDFHHSLHVMFTGEQFGYYQSFKGAKDFQKCLRDNFVYDGQYSPYRKRKHGRKANDLAPDKFVVAMQNHDQIGNRAFGERLCHLISLDECQIAAALLLLSPFVPMLFQGEEWASSSPFLYFTDHVDEKLAQAVRDGRQKEFSYKHEKVPDPQAIETYLKSKLDWSEISNDKHHRMLNWHRELIRIRNENLDQIRKHRPQFSIIDQNQRIYSYRAGNLYLIANCGDSEFTIDDNELANCRVIIQNKEFKKSGAKLILKPASVVVFKKQ
ncbi:MAG: malto-oligosyltrehalose trehalohydrolase [Candidatus Rifleibacteriota bacterium]